MGILSATYCQGLIEELCHYVHKTHTQQINCRNILTMKDLTEEYVNFFLLSVNTRLATRGKKARGRAGRLDCEFQNSKRKRAKGTGDR